MSSANSAVWHHGVKYSADSACQHCDGIIHHEPWCIMVNAAVSYAYEVLLDARKLSIADELMLHALGVAWDDDYGKCPGACVG